jgi:hypothetical protein
MPEPYRTNARPPPCAHKRFTEEALTGGAGPDYAAAILTCSECGAHGYRYMPPYVGLDWGTPCVCRGNPFVKCECPCPKCRARLVCINIFGPG